jgi:hypothetical protein
MFSCHNKSKILYLKSNIIRFTTFTVNMKTLVKYLVVVFLTLISATGFSQVTKVLYLGNSHTFWHDLPQITADLALANGDTMMFEVNAPGGCTLAHPSNGHLFNSLSLALIDSLEWDFVVLQEQSNFAIIDYYLNNYTFPGARVLDSLIKQNYNCTRTIMQLIWAKKEGGQQCINSYCSIDFDDYSHMQDSLTSSYLRVKDSIRSILAPTGEAWRLSIENGDPIELFDSDGNHASYAGHYLTACVYYAIMYDKTPVGIPFYGELNQSDAEYLQQIAHDVVYANPELWNMYPIIPEAGFSYIQFDNTVYFNDQSVNATEYLWDFGDGSTDSISSPNHTYLESGSFLVTQMVGNQCNYDWHYDTVNVVITDTDKHPNSEASLNVYHNYSTHQLFINSEVSLLSVTLADISGNEVVKHNCTNNNDLQINTSYLKSGIYIVTVATEDRIVVKKIMR